MEIIAAHFNNDAAHRGSAYMMIWSYKNLDFKPIQGCWLWLWVTDQHNGHPIFRECCVLLFLLSLKTLVSTTSHQGNLWPFCPSDMCLRAHNTFYYLLPLFLFSSMPSVHPVSVKTDCFSTTSSASPLTSHICPPKQPKSKLSPEWVHV